MLSPIRTTFHNSANIVQSSPCQTVSFAGKEYELKVIDEKTPILFQWFEPNPERYKKDEVPIVNTKEGANKQVISSQADSLIKISRIWADFFPANTSNQPI
ncbi:T3SS effector NleB [Escherichia coli]|nr:T3SS effector NleB [Escherichia coli]